MVTLSAIGSREWPVSSLGRTCKFVIFVKPALKLQDENFKKFICIIHKINKLNPTTLKFTSTAPPQYVVG
jgi:hypothetical protein